MISLKSPAACPYVVQCVLAKKLSPAETMSALHSNITIQLVTDRYQLQSVTICNQLTSAVGHIREYPQIAETYPQTTTSTNTLNTQQAFDLLIV
ncbi:MAG TPA: hypothetical protein PLV08_06145 [Flavobacteriales bacterium]|nr:hypothetical protein [Flavobacteriales bacterium]MBP7156045.1 hypothetical protein [Flavobacteriales bacterium]HQX99337.1 hypothetical protein [Flavobacteriales bacterium]